MNKNQRKRLERAAELIEKAKEIIYEVKYEEQEKFDGLSEGLQATAVNKMLESNAETLETMGDALETELQELNQIME